jgi:hypothetical protein
MRRLSSLLRLARFVVLSFLGKRIFFHREGASEIVDTLLLYHFLCLTMC